jgi:hypothetical protein
VDHLDDIDAGDDKVSKNEVLFLTLLQTPINQTQQHYMGRYKYC